MNIEYELNKRGNFYHDKHGFKVYKHKKSLKKYFWVSNENYKEFLQRIFNDINQTPTGDKK